MYLYQKYCTICICVCVYIYNSIYINIYIYIYIYLYLYLCLYYIYIYRYVYTHCKVGKELTQKLLAYSAVEVMAAGRQGTALALQAEGLGFRFFLGFRVI